MRKNLINYFIVIINFNPNPLYLKELSLYLHCQIISKVKPFRLSPG